MEPTEQCNYKPFWRRALRQALEYLTAAAIGGAVVYLALRAFAAGIW